MRLPLQAMAASASARVAVFAAVAVIVATAGGSDGLEAFLIGFGILVVVPLAASVLSVKHGVMQPDVAHAMYAGTLAFAAFAFPAGPVAGGMALPWFVLTVIAAAQCLRTTAQLQRLSLLSTLLSHLYLAFGALWLFMSRLGLRPHGFTYQIVLLTAAHFHYAGFVLPAFAAVVMNRSRGIPRRICACAFAIVLLGPAFVAYGIAYSPNVELGAAMILAAGVTLLAVLQLLEAATVCSTGLGKALVAFSSLSAVAAMGLVVPYALGEKLGIEYISIKNMVCYHGLLNALGFLFCGLLAWRFEDAIALVGTRAVPFSRIFLRRRMNPSICADTGAEWQPAPGFISRLGVFAGPAFHPAEVVPAVRQFFEATSEQVVPAASIRMNATAAVFFRLFAWWSGQCRFNELRRAAAASILTRLEPLASTCLEDARVAHRAAPGAGFLYSAIYGRHCSTTTSYFHSEIPLPGIALAMVLRVENGPAGALVLTTRQTNDEDHAGLYLVRPHWAWRLPVSQQIRVDPLVDGTTAQVTVTGKLGLIRLRLSYVSRNSCSAKQDGGCESWWPLSLVGEHYYPPESRKCL